MRLRPPDIAAITSHLPSMNSARLNKSADGEQVPAAVLSGPLRIHGKAPLNPKSIILIKGPLVLNVNVGDGSFLHCDTELHYHESNTVGVHTAATEFGLMQGDGFATSQKGAEGFAFPGVIDAAEQTIGNNCTLKADRGIYIRSCGEETNLLSKNGLIYIDGNVGKDVSIVNSFGDVFVRGNIAEGASIHARNIACLGSVGSECELNATRDIYVDAARISPDARLDGEVLVPQRSKIHQMIMKNPLEGTLEDHVVGLVHPDGEPPKGWTHYTQQRSGGAPNR